MSEKEQEQGNSDFSSNGHPCLELDLLYKHLLEDLKHLESAWSGMQQRIITASALMSVALSVFVGGNPRVLALPFTEGWPWLAALETTFLIVAFVQLVSFVLAIRPRKAPGLYSVDNYMYDYHKNPCELYAQLTSDLTPIIKTNEHENLRMARLLAWATYSAALALILLGVLVVLAKGR